MHIIKIFLGSSITELHYERVILGDYLMNSVRPIFKNDGIEVEVLKCEDIRSGNIGTPPQHDIDKLLSECDVSVFLFKGKAGEMTVHEFDVAQKLQKRKRHEIYVFCFDVPEAEKSTELKDFQKRLIEEKFYWYTCKDIADLESQFILGLLKYERLLLEIKSASTVIQENITEKDGDTRFAEYEQNEQKQSQLREKIHQDIDELVQQAKTVMANEDDTIAAKIVKVIELYKKADRWAAATTYDKKKYFYLLSDYAWFLEEYGLYHDAEVIYLRQIGLAEELYGNEHEITSTSYNNIGGIYWKQSDYDKTIEYLHKALTIRERIFGTKHSETASIYNNLGLVYKNKGDYNKAIEFHFKALEIREEELGMEDPSIAQSNMNIASVYNDLGEYNKALEYYQKALAIIEKSPDSEDPSAATTYNDIGLVYLSQDDYDNALLFMLKALSIREKNYGTNNPETAISYNSLGMFYSKQSNFGKAMEYLFKALAIREKHLDKEHPSIATSYNEIGLVYQAIGKYKTALDYYNKAYQIRKNKLGKEHPYTKAVLKNIKDTKQALDSSN
jgi:tetratricopeptide (TPR) repeat protein